MHPTVLVTGATGFVGRAVIDELSTKACTVLATSRQPIALGRRAPRPDDRVPPKLSVVAADLDEPATLKRLADDVQAMIHLAHRITGTPEQLEQTNVLGTGALLREVAPTSSCRIVALGTAAVYDASALSGPIGLGTTPVPRSKTSQSRLRSDELVLAAGGTVVRPHLVYGPGDKWFLPRALQLTARCGWVEGGRARHSILSVRDLARGIVALVLGTTAPPRLVLAGPTTAPTMRDFLVARALEQGLSLPKHDTELATALADPAGRDDPRWHHDLRLLATSTVLEASPGLFDSAQSTDQPAWGRRTSRTAGRTTTQASQEDLYVSTRGTI